MERAAPSTARTRVRAKAPQLLQDHTHGGNYVDADHGHSSEQETLTGTSDKENEAPAAQHAGAVAPSHATAVEALRAELAAVQEARQRERTAAHNIYFTIHQIQAPWTGFVVI